MSADMTGDEQAHYSPEEIAEAKAEDAREKARIEEIKRTRREAKRARDARLGAEAYNEVFTMRQHTDPLDLLFVLPEWVPPPHQAQHRRSLAKLLEEYSREEIRRAFIQYKEQIARDHAAQYTPRDPTPTTLFWASPIFRAEAFRHLAAILWAFEIGEAEGPEAGRLALGEDPEDVRVWQLGKKMRAWRKMGGEATAEIRSQSRAKDRQWVLQECRDYINKHRIRRFTRMCKDVGKNHTPERTEGWVRNIFKQLQPSITAKNFRSDPRLILPGS